MPLYDYRCTSCGREVEVMHSIHDQGPETCAACGGTMHKVLSPPAIHFKGSGWAKKDAASTSAKAAKTASPAPAKEGATATDAGEATPGAEGRAASAETGSKPVPATSSTSD
jgi:putative FmdB family regulatory protein